jgi:hypothetical protein
LSRRRRDLRPERRGSFGITKLNAAGGGVDIQVTKLMAIRPVQAEYFLSTIPDGLNSRQNSFRFSAGVVFRLGKK